MKMDSTPSNRELAEMIGMEKEVHDIMNAGVRLKSERKRAKKVRLIIPVKKVVRVCLNIGALAAIVALLYYIIC